MAEFEVRINPTQHLAYIPKSIRKILGNRPFAVTGRAAVVLFSDESSIEDVAKSLAIIQEDLKHAVELSKRETKTTKED